MNLKATMMMGLTLPFAAFGQTAPSVDQNYCSGTSLNPPISTFVTGLCNAGNSVIAALQNYKTGPSSSASTSSGGLFSHLALGSSKSSSTTTTTAPVAAAPAPSAPPPAAPASNNQPANPYTYS